MTVISESPLCMKIYLNRSEVALIFHSYEAINCKNPQVKRIVMRLFRIGCKNFEFINNGNVLTELFPTRLGGCVFRFTGEPIFGQFVGIRFSQKRKYIPMFFEPICFIFKNGDVLTDALLAVQKRFKNRPIYGNLYYHSGRYFLLLKLFQNDSDIALMLNEFCICSKKANYLESVLSEHFDLVCKNIFKNKTLEN